MSGSARRWLAPLVPLYRLGLAVRERYLASRPEAIRKLEWPAVSIGNLSTGGTGKTPLTIALARAFVARGMHVDVLSRGYGRAGSGTVWVQEEDSAQHVGDEPVLIARQAGVPVFVDRERYRAGLLAEVQQRPDGLAVHLLDDGFQHRQLHRDVDILLLNRRDWRDTLLPAGNLREKLSAVKRADVVAIPADEPELEIGLRDSGWQGQIWKLWRRMEIPTMNGPAIAFCGIARPEQFFAGLEAAGVRLTRKISFPDHHQYTEKDLKRLTEIMRSTGATTLLTTDKDHARLGRMADDLLLRTVGLRTVIEDEAAALAWLLERLKSSKKNREI